MGPYAEIHWLLHCLWGSRRWGMLYCVFRVFVIDPHASTHTRTHTHTRRAWKRCRLTIFGQWRTNGYLFIACGSSKNEDRWFGIERSELIWCRNCIRESRFYRVTNRCVWRTICFWIWQRRRGFFAYTIPTDSSCTVNAWTFSSNDKTTQFHAKCQKVRKP